MTEDRRGKRGLTVPPAASPVNILGRVLGDATQFRAVRSGEKVRLVRADGE